MTTKNKNLVIFDGDGDGISAAAIWLIDKPEEYLTITNKQKNERQLIKRIFEIPKYSQLKKVGIFDLDAEQNIDAIYKLQQNMNIDFIDHHTKDPSIIPNYINNFVQKDTRENCASTISYEVAKGRGLLKTFKELSKAAQLATIGLANDGKERASKDFGKEILLRNEIELLTDYGKAINFGAATGKMNSSKILNGLVKSDFPLVYLLRSEQPNELIEERQNAITSLINNSEIEEREGIVLYKLPSKTDLEKEISVIGYNEFMNSQMIKAPDKIHIALIETPEGKYTFSARSQDGLAYRLIENLAKNYDKTAFGRDTAAGFTTERKVEQRKLLEEVLKARK